MTCTAVSPLLSHQLPHIATVVKVHHKYTLTHNTMLTRLRTTQGPRILWSLATSTPTMCHRLIGTRTPIHLAKIVMKVPTMGDSITEGTIVAWTVGVGEAVKEGDVVALIETDKVTVDIKAETDGVLTQQYGELDQTVEVGAKLYEIDTEAEAAVISAPVSETATQPVSASPMERSSQETSPHADAADSIQGSRMPSISFLGKEGWMARLNGAEHQPSPAKPEVPVKPNAVVVLDGSMLSTRYGRPDFSDEEMEALMLGGANVAPSVVVPSSGAVFSVAHSD